MTANTHKPMTPEYASPEQVGGERLTTATDIYSLGVVFYELLTGRRPHDFPSRSPAAVYRILREQQPPMRPSATVGPSDSAALRRQLRGDLDSIALKALALEPRHRYGSVEGFSEDIRNALTGRPVLAQKAGPLYPALKFIGRNRLPVASLVAVLTILLAAALFSNRARRRAEFRRGQAEDLIGFMLGDLKNRLDSLGRLDVLDQVGKQAQAYFATVPERQLNGETLRKHIDALINIGEVRFRQGQTRDALESFHEAQVSVAMISL